MSNDKYQQDAQRIIDAWEKRTSWDSGEREVAAEIARIRAEAAHEERMRCKMFLLEGRHEFSRGEYYSRMKIHDFIDKIVKKINSAILTTKNPSESRACETCKNEWGALTKEEMWDTIQRIRELTENDGTESPEQTVARLVENLAAAGEKMLEASQSFEPQDWADATDELREALAALNRLAGKDE
jgi:hypothetical protein